MLQFPATQIAAGSRCSYHCPGYHRTVHQLREHTETYHVATSPLYLDRILTQDHFTFYSDSLRHASTPRPLLECGSSDCICSSFHGSQFEASSVKANPQGTRFEFKPDAQKQKIRAKDLCDGRGDELPWSATARMGLYQGDKRKEQEKRSKDVHTRRSSYPLYS